MASDDTRDRLLDATLAVIARLGACRLTLEAVAAEAGVSKGGLLYHFPDKESLLAGLLDRHLDRQTATRLAAEAANEDTTEGRLHALVSVIAQRADAHAALPLVGIIALEPHLLARPRRIHAELLDTLRRDQARFPQALVVMLATSGLTLGEVFGTIPLTPAERSAVILEMHRLVDRLPPAAGR